MPKKFDAYQEITDLIVQAIETAQAEGEGWRMPWHSMAGGIPRNGVTGNDYRGLNILILWGAQREKRFGTDEWASFKQWQTRGGSVRKGERGTPVTFFKMMEYDDGKKFPLLRISRVFNRAQVEGLPSVAAIGEPSRDLVERLDYAERVIAATRAKIDRDGHKACYHRAADTIEMPSTHLFIDGKHSTATESYYSTLLHELAHWTGSPERLDRTKGKRFGDTDYAFAELVAEMSAAFLCAKLEITAEPRKDHALYIGSWLKALKSDKKYIFQASSLAMKAVDFVMNTAPQPTESMRLAA